MLPLGMDVGAQRMIGPGAGQLVQQLRRFGVLVGEPRPTEARYNLADTQAVYRWLESLLTPVHA